VRSVGSAYDGAASWGMTDNWGSQHVDAGVLCVFCVFACFRVFVVCCLCVVMCCCLRCVLYAC
jgi:hypothetical protein